MPYVDCRPRGALLAACALVLCACPDAGSNAGPPDAAPWPFCGDGIQQEDEDCEVVGETFPAGCNACSICGNGRVSGYESCDDGNSTAGDGCSGCLRPGDVMGWEPGSGEGWSPAAPRTWLLVARPGGGVRGLSLGAGPIDVLDAVMREDASRHDVSVAAASGYYLDSASNTPDGGLVICTHDQHSTGTSVIVALDAAGQLRWATPIEAIPNRSRRCYDVAVDAALGHVLVPLESMNLSSGPSFPEMGLLRFDLATGQLIRHTTLSHYADGGALGVQNVSVGSVVVLDDSTVVVGGGTSATPIIAALGSDDTLLWKVTPPRQVMHMVAHGDRVAVLGNDGVSVFRANGAMPFDWSFGRNVLLAAVDRGLTGVVTYVEEGDHGRFSRWSIEGSAGFDVLHPLGLDGGYRGLALGDDGVTYTVHHEVGSDGRLLGLSP